MAAFSYQHPPFLLDSVFLSSPPIRMPGFTGEGNINATCFSQFCPSQSLHEIPGDSDGDGRVIGSRSLQHSSNLALSDNEPCVTQKLSTDSSSVVDRLERGEQVTQKVAPAERKRRSRDGSSLTCAQSKDAREGKGKKAKKGNGGVKDGGELQQKVGKKDQKKGGEEPPTGYIHVRARRGQATDSHSLAERVRREKISERMKLLQALVPGCDKVTGKALMLDEIINYVQSLQNQVEFLSMKLASVNPMLYDFGMEVDALMVRPERLSALTTPPPSLPSLQQSSPCQPTAYADATTTPFTATNNYPVMDPTSASLLFQQPPHRLNVFSQEDNGSPVSMWGEVEDQRHKFIHPSALITNNLCCFN